MNNRVIVVPLEPRAGIARYDAATDTMDLELTGQGLHGIRRQLAEFVFKVPLERIQLHAPDVGGGFGMKNFLYPEWILLLWAARKLGRPVRWVADRAEEFVSGAQGRDIAATARLGARRRRHASWRSTWRWSPISAPISRATVPARRRSRPRRRMAASTTFPRSPSTCAASSPTPCRSMPIAAPASPRPTTSSSAPSRRRRAQLGRDPADLRRQNLIASFPHKTAMGMAIDSGDFVANLDAAVVRADTDGVRGAARRAPRRAAGCAASASPASSRPRAARPTKAPRCASSRDGR